MFDAPLSVPEFAARSAHALGGFTLRADDGMRVRDQDVGGDQTLVSMARSRFRRMAALDRSRMISNLRSLPAAGRAASREDAHGHAGRVVDAVRPRRRESGRTGPSSIIALAPALLPRRLEIRHDRADRSCASRRGISRRPRQQCDVLPSWRQGLFLPERSRPYVEPRRPRGIRQRVHVGRAGRDMARPIRRCFPLIR